MNSTNQYIFILGREQKIALLELSSVLRRFCFDIETNPITSLSDNCVLINTEKNDDDVKELMNVLGGTTKIFKVLGEEKRLSENSLVKYFKVKPGKRLTFGISSYSKKIPVNTINMLGLKLKKMFKQSGSVRFVALRGELELSTATSHGQRLYSDGTELGVFYDESARKIGIGKLIAMTDPGEWSHRDFDKPKSDKFSGMVPPKLARMMVNIALGSTMVNDQLAINNNIENCKLPEGSVSARKIENSNNIVVCDPFCGSGNILMEAMMLGCNVVGSDLSEKAVNDTKINLAWLKDNTPAVQELSEEIFQADATTFDFSKLTSQSANQLKSLCIVAEPYLGEPKKFKPSRHAAKGEYTAVKEIYINFLKNISRLPSAVSPLALCLVFPAVETVEGKIFSLLKESVDEINDLGYTLVCKPLLYGRDYQVVKREIVLLQKTTNN